MAFTVQTPQTHPGAQLYICEAPAEGRRRQYALEGYRDKAVRFDDRADAEIAIMQFSSLYGLVIIEVET